MPPDRFDRYAEPKLSAELRLVAACCGWPHTDDSLERVRVMGAAVGNWREVERLARVHRVMPLVQAALSSSGLDVPSETAASLRKAARKAVEIDLKMAAATIALQKAFDEAGIAMLVLKGVTVGTVAYGRPGMKQSYDIDILVREEHRMAAHRKLCELGYRAMWDERQSDAASAVIHEFEYVHPSGRRIDLHTRPFESRKMLAEIDPVARARVLTLPGGELRMLDDDVMFAYLAFHGAKSHWARLKWLADFNAFAQARREQLGVLVDSVDHYGVSRSVSVALQLCGDLFGSRWPTAVAKRLEDSAVTRALRADIVSTPSFRGISHRNNVRTPLLQLQLEKGADYLRDFLSQRWISAIDRVNLPLPRRLAFAYHVMRIPLALYRMTGRALVSATGRKRSATE